MKNVYETLEDRDTVGVMKYVDIDKSIYDEIEVTRTPTVDDVGGNFRKYLFSKLSNINRINTILNNACKNITDDRCTKSKLYELSPDIQNKIFKNMTKIDLPTAANNNGTFSGDLNKTLATSFLILFQKTFGDFSQIALSRYLVENQDLQPKFEIETAKLNMKTVPPSCKITKTKHRQPLSVWTVSYDIMMTNIALYYGANIIKQGKSGGENNKGYVSYGFSNLEAVNSAAEYDEVEDDVIVLDIDKLENSKKAL